MSTIDDDDDDYDYESDRILSENRIKYEIPFSEAIRADDREAFVRLRENYYESFYDTIRLGDIWSICRVGAVNCASALFESPDTIPLIDLNAPRELRGHYPLIVASRSFSYDVVDLLLRHGARTDLVATGYEWKTADIPLKQVLDMLDYHAYLIDWNPKKSIYTLVTILCLPQMSVILETLKLLVWNTKDVNEVFNYYAEKEEGKLVQMAVLIMVARDLFSPLPLQSKCDSFFAESMCAYQSVKQEFEFLATLEKKLLVEAIELKDRMAYLMYVFALFELFDKAGDAIRSYLQSRESSLPREVVIEDVAKILKKAQLNLKHEDIDLSNIDLFEPGKDGSFSEHKVLHPLEYEFQSAKLKDFMWRVHRTVEMGDVVVRELMDAIESVGSYVGFRRMQRKECWNLVRRLKLLVPLLEEILVFLLAIDPKPLQLSLHAFKTPPTTFRPKH